MGFRRKNGNILNDNSVSVSKRTASQHQNKNSGFINRFFVHKELRVNKIKVLGYLIRACDTFFLK